MAKGPISNVYITAGSSANGARYPASRWEAFPSVIISSNTASELNDKIHPSSSSVVMVALMAPWPPAQMTLTTVGLAWRLQCLTWGMRMMRTSMTRTTMKINLSTPRHSNKHSPSNHPHRGNLVPLLCVLLQPFPLFPMPVFLSGFSQGCRWILRELGCMFPPQFFFSAPESHVPAPQLWGTKKKTL